MYVQNRAQQIKRSITLNIENRDKQEKKLRD